MKNNVERKPNSQSGMALVTVLIFGVVAIIVITLSITLMVIQTDSSRNFTSGQETLSIAESGAENALIRLLRNPNYSGESLTFPGGTATIVVTNGANKTITVTAQTLFATRTIQVVTTDQDGFTVIDSWGEI